MESDPVRLVVLWRWEVWPQRSHVDGGIAGADACPRSGRARMTSKPSQAGREEPGIRASPRRLRRDQPRPEHCAQYSGLWDSERRNLSCFKPPRFVTPVYGGPRRLTRPLHLLVSGQGSGAEGQACFRTISSSL